jgi:hypothetical protein
MPVTPPAPGVGFAGSIPAWSAGAVRTGLEPPFPPRAPLPAHRHTASVRPPYVLWCLRSSPLAHLPPFFTLCIIVSVLLVQVANSSFVSAHVGGAQVPHLRSHLTHSHAVPLQRLPSATPRSSPAVHTPPRAAFPPGMHWPLSEPPRGVYGPQPTAAIPAPRPYSYEHPDHYKSVTGPRTTLAPHHPSDLPMPPCPVHPRPAYLPEVSGPWAAPAAVPASVPHDPRPLPVPADDTGARFHLR